MNITVINSTLLVFILLFFSRNSFAEDSNFESKASRDFSFTLEMMGGLSYNLNEDNYNSKKLGITPSIRILWMPDNKLNFGIESSYLVVRKTDKEKNKQILKARLEAVPIFLLFNTKALVLDLTFGLGVSYMRSTINAFNDISVANQWHYCFNFGVGYSFNISSHFGAGIEGKIFSLTKTDEIVSAAYIKLIYHFLY